MIKSESVWVNPSILDVTLNTFFKAAKQLIVNQVLISFAIQILAIPTQNAQISNNVFKISNLAVITHLFFKEMQLILAKT